MSPALPAHIQDKGDSLAQPTTTRAHPPKDYLNTAVHELLVAGTECERAVGGLRTDAQIVAHNVAEEAERRRRADGQPGSKHANEEGGAEGIGKGPLLLSPPPLLSALKVPVKAGTEDAGVRVGPSGTVVGLRDDTEAVLDAIAEGEERHRLGKGPKKSRVEEGCTIKHTCNCAKKIRTQAGVLKGVCTPPPPPAQLSYPPLTPS